MRRHKITLLGVAAAALLFAFAPTAVAQVAVSGTFYGPHGAISFGTGVPYGGYYGPYSPGYYTGTGYYGHEYCAPYSGYSGYSTYYAPAPVYVRPYRPYGYYGGHYGPRYYAPRPYAHRYYGHGHGGYHRY